jgi:tripartite ATP-independent transporter DctP family solute receptor
MDRRRLLTLALGSATAGGLGLVAGCGKHQPAAPAGPLAVQLSDPVAASNPMVGAERYFAAQVGTLTDGRYRVDVVPGGALGDDNRVNEMVRTGRLAFAKTLLSNLTAYDKRLGVVGLPYVFADQNECISTLAGDLGRRCTAILDECGLVVLAYFYGGDRNIYNSKRPIHTPDDLKGLRIRVPQNILSIDMINALGASALPMATNDVLSALRQRLVDGAENNVVYYTTEQHVLQAPYFALTHHQQSVDVLLASKRWLADQPAATRDAIMTAGERARSTEVKTWTEAENLYTTQAGTEGALLSDVDIGAFQRALAPVFDDHRGTFGDLTNLLPNY